jgi:SAM-dependent MidA family methyltransferase
MAALSISSEQSELTLKLQQKIVDTINNTSTLSIPFSQYMNMALYDAQYGYYNNLLYKFGAAGDFVTAPLVSDMFAKCIANQCVELFAHGCPTNILEIGAGNGQLMLDLLIQLDNQDIQSNNPSKLQKYYILELSASLAQLQQERLQLQLPHLLDKVIWLDKLPTSFDGIILGNEVLDAQPCEVVKWQDNQVYVRHVTVSIVDESSDNVDNNLPDLPKFKFQDRIVNDEAINDAVNDTTSEEIKAIVRGINININTTDTYVSEISLANRGFIKTLSQTLNKGCILLIDYGYPDSEYYTPTRNLGTLRGFFRHHMLTDVLQYAGLIDITASVDFTAIANAGINNNLDLIGYTTQANFLINCGLLDILSDIKNNISNTKNNNTNTENSNNKDTEDNIKYLQLTNQINKLTSINEMGEIFKVIGFSKNIEFADWVGFKNRDLSHTL